MSGRFRPPMYFFLVSGLVYLFLFVLNLLGMDSMWIDRFIIAEIAITAAFTVYAMLVATEKWSLRGLGIWGFMFAILTSYIVGQFVEWGIIDVPLPFYIRNTWRSMLAVAGPLMIYGFYRWRNFRALDDPLETPRNSHDRER